MFHVMFHAFRYINKSDRTVKMINKLAEIGF